MNQITVRDVLLVLEELGWSDLIDGRWEEDVIADIKGQLPNVSEEVLKEALEIVLIK